MSFRQIEVYECDYCGAQAGRASKFWFLVNGQQHACDMCGHGLMDLLARLRVNYQKVCNMYTDRDVDTFGIIDFVPGQPVDLDLVALVAAARFRRPG